jgi:dihydropyrimidinase
VTQQKEESMSILIQHGTVVSSESCTDNDVYIEDGTITDVGEALSYEADEVIEAQGKYVMPGLVDPHVHLELGSGWPLETCDDFTVGTTAAAFGGTTSILHFCVQKDREPFSETLDRELARLDQQPAIVDVGFHLVVRDLSFPGALDDLSDVVERGATSYKLFMAFKGVDMVDDATLYKVLRSAAETGALTMVHAENGEVIDLLVHDAIAHGNLAPEWHALTRPPLLEAEAVNRAICLARVAESPLYVVHVSCHEALAPIRRAREAGCQVWGETCPQYLFSTSTDLARPNLEGIKFVFTPPPRSQADHEHLWEALSDGSLSVVATDHAPFRWADQKIARHDNFSVIPNGAPGIEHRLQLMYTLGVEQGRLTISRLVDLLAESPARLFGLYPRKGRLSPGADADVVILDPAQRAEVSTISSHSNAGYCLYEGIETVAQPEIVILRGSVLIRDGSLVADPGIGQYLVRAPFTTPYQYTEA